MTTTTTTTIAGVSVLARGGAAGHPFDLGLSPECIEIRRPGQSIRRMSWSRVSEWELEQRADDVVLTLRGDGATTPLLITGWSFDDLDALMRTVTSAPVAPPEVADPHDSVEDDAAAQTAVAAVTAAPTQTDEQPTEQPDEPAAPPSRRERRRRRGLGAKATLTVVLLVLLAAAVALVLLQSAGVIHWGFLGPTA